MISVASGVEGTGATAIRQPNASRLTASGARSGGRLGGILQPLDSPSIRASSLGLKPRSTKSPATTSASMRKATSCSMKAGRRALAAQAERHRPRHPHIPADHAQNRRRAL